MNMNPFLNQSPLNAPLQQELCQRIQYEAWTRALSLSSEETFPQSLRSVHLRRQRRLFGRTSLLVHPTDLEKMFAGVTLAVYHTIEHLYCSLHARSIAMVWHLVTAMAQHAGTPPVAYEAVWSICLFLEERRLRATKILLERSNTQWWIVSLVYEQHTILCLLDPEQAQVLAFHINDSQGMCVSYERVLYDGIVSQRHPSTDAPSGLSWSLPRDLFTEDVVSPTFREACTSLGIALRERHERRPFVQMLYEGWSHEYQQRTLPARQRRAVFDRYLDRVYGYGPLRTQEEIDKSNVHLSGYNQDPSWLFPVLRLLLPQQEGGTIDTGAVFYDGLHYTDELLLYCPKGPITIRRSLHIEARIWVYLNGEIVCQAMARELRRHDGTYRLARREG